MKAIIYLLVLVGACFASGKDAADALVDSVYESNDSLRKWSDIVAVQFPELFSEYDKTVAERILKMKYASLYDIKDTSMDALVSVSGGSYLIDREEFAYETMTCRHVLIFWTKYVDANKDYPESIPFYAHIRCLERGYDAMVLRRQK